MSNIKLSATRINTFLSCKQKYWFNYYEKLPKLANPSFKLGLAVHSSLEFAGKIWLEKGKFTKTDVKNILSYYDKVSIEEGIDDHSTHLEGKNLVKSRLANFISGQKLLGLETKFGFSEDNYLETDEGVPLIGAIDKVEEYDHDTLLIVDYKTSKTVPTADQLRHDIQLSMYDLVARKLWPNYKRIILALDMLKTEIVYTYRTEEQQEEFKLYLKKIYDEMVRFDKEKAKPSLNLFCSWCDFKDYCDEYKRACENSAYEFQPIMSYSDDQLVEEWKKVRSIKKLLDGREKQLSMVMMEKIVNNSENIATDSEEVYIRQNSRSEYDLDTIVNVVPQEDFPKLVKVDKSAVNKYLNNNPKIKPIVEESMNKSYTSPFLATKKVSKG